jgi:integrase
MQVVIRNEVIYLHFPYNGKYIRRSTGLKATKSNIKYIEDVKIPELQVKMNNKTLFANDDNKVPTVDEYMEKSFEIHKHQIRELTHKRYQRVYNLHIKKTFGHKKLDEIKVSDIGQWQSALLEKLEAKTVHTMRIVLGKIFNDAMKDQIIKINPVSLAPSLKRTSSHDYKVFNVDEIFKVLSHIDEKMRCFFAIGFFTGMRTGEIIGLKWSDIDFEKRTIHIQRSIRQGIEDVPKTKNSIRKIDIIDVLMPYLKSHFDASLGNTCKYVFVSNRGEAYTTGDKISSHFWRNALKDAKIPYVRMYQMRHSFASMMIGNGEDILWVSNMLGHKDSSTTLQVYAKYVKRDDKKRGEFLVHHTQNHAK